MHVSVVFMSIVFVVVVAFWIYTETPAGKRWIRGE